MERYSEELIHNFISPWFSSVNCNCSSIKIWPCLISIFFGGIFLWYTFYWNDHSLLFLLCFCSLKITTDWWFQLLLFITFGMVWLVGRSFLSVREKETKAVKEVVVLHSLCNIMHHSHTRLFYCLWLLPCRKTKMICKEKSA